MKLRKLTSLFALLLLVPVCALAATNDDPRAQEILKQARTAIGGAELLQSVQGVTIKGEYRRLLGERELTGDREVNVMLPDK